MIPMMFPRPIQLGALASPVASLAATQTSYGDARFKWAQSGNQAPQYLVTVINPSNGATVRTATVTGVTHWDYPVDLSAADFGFTPTYFAFTVTPCNSNGVAIGPVSAQYGGTPTLDNSYVVKMFVIAGDSNAAAWFNSASGATPNLQAATTFRTQYAANFGLQPWQVMPISAGFGSAVVDIATDVNYPTAPNNYFWNTDADTPGPNALAYTSAVTAAGLPVAGIIWVLRNDLSAWFSTRTPEPTPVRSFGAHEALFAYFRANANGGAAPIFISPANSGFTLPGPVQSAPGGTQQFQLLQAELCAQVTSTVMATPNEGPDISYFVPEPSPNQNTYLHFTPAAYNQTAKDFANAILNGTNLAAPGQTYDPTTFVAPPAIGVVESDTNGNVIINFTDALNRTLGSVSYSVQIMTTDGSNTVVRNLGTTSANSITYTAAQIAIDYGYTPTYLGVQITQTIGSNTSQPLEWNGNVSAEASYGTPSSLTITRNTYGDIRLGWSVTGGSTPPAFAVVLKNPSSGATVRSPVVMGQNFYDYTVDQNAADYGFVPTAVSFTVASANSSGTPIGQAQATNGSPTVDNSHVTALLAVSGDSQSAAHFEVLSGATANLWSATTLRDAYATNNGLNPAQVMPLSIATGSASAEKAADTTGENEYYWDLNGGVPGPLLTAAISTIQATGVNPSIIFWDLNTDTGAFDDTSITPTPTATRFYQAMVQIFAYFRSQFSNPNLPIFICPTFGAYQGTPEELVSPYAFEQVNGAYALISYQQAGKTYYSQVPPASSISDFIPEPAPNQDQYIHYQPAIYQKIANAYAAAIKNSTNLAGSGQQFEGDIFPVAPETLAAFQDGSGNTYLTWTDGLSRSTLTGFTWEVRIYNEAGTSVIRTITGITGTTFEYTAAMGTTDFGSPPGYITFDVLQVSTVGTSQPQNFTNNVTTLAGPTGLVATQNPNGDLIYTWNSTAGVSYFVTSYNVENNAVAHTATVTATGATASWTYTAAMQQADYSQTTLNVYFGVQQIQAGTGYYGNMTTKNGTATPWAVAPTTLKAVYDGSGNIVMSFVGDATKEYQLINYNVTNDAVQSTNILPAGTQSWAGWTAAAQTALYGFTSHNVYWTVGAYDPGSGNVGPLGTYNKAATSS